MKLLISLLAISLITSSFTPKKDSVHLHNGDLIFIKSSAPNAKLMKKATGGKYNHCGIVIIQNGFFKILEVTDSGISFTDLPSLYNRGNGKVVIKRLKNWRKYISDTSKKQYKEFRTLGANYTLKSVDNAFSWNNEALYSSELVWKFYKEIIGIELCELETLKDFNTKNRKVKAALKEVYGENIPFNEKMVSIKSLYNSELLETVK